MNWFVFANVLVEYFRNTFIAMTVSIVTQFYSIVIIQTVPEPSESPGLIATVVSEKMGKDGML
jgi:hypothetical protein